MTTVIPQISALLIAGPTASGKSALAIAEARRRNGVIINADSMQVYRELRILSARPSEEEVASVPHLLYGHVSGAENYSVARWLADVAGAMQVCWEHDQLPILCGGTGLYFKAALEGLAEIPPISAEIREKWRRFEGDVHGELQKHDAAAAAKLHPADRQRIVRALEVVEATGHTLGYWKKAGQGRALLNQINVEKLYLEVSREELHERAERRLDLMLQHGALAEVRNLPAFNADRPIMKAIGVPEFQAHLRGEISLEKAIEKAKASTRQYIKRQTTWWRGQMPGWSLVKPQ